MDILYDAGKGKAVLTAGVCGYGPVFSDRDNDMLDARELASLFVTWLGVNPCTVSEPDLIARYADFLNELDDGEIVVPWLL